LIKRLDRIDRGMFKVFPQLSRYAWLTMLEMQKSSSVS
jgi:hypothetical protein